MDFSYNVDICSYVVVPAMTNIHPEDWSKCLGQHGYNDSYLHVPFFPTGPGNEHSSKAIYGGSFPFLASLVH